MVKNKLRKGKKKQKQKNRRDNDGKVTGKIKER